MRDDLDLLRCFAKDGAEAAFAELVRRHLNLVYSAALRQVRSPQLAEEVAQSVFTDLARNAGGLKPGTVLAAWLYQVTRRTAIDMVRREARRQLREQVAVEMNAMNPTSSDWAQVEPLLDDAMTALDDADRTAVLLRYFENKSLREVGMALGTSDDTAQKRVSRAVDRLRDFFAQRGLTVGASGLAVVISANAVHAAPVGLAAAIATTAALAGTTLATTVTITATQAIAMTTLQKSLVAVSLAAAVGTGVYQARQASRLQRELNALQPMAAQIEQLRGEHDALAKRLATKQREVEQLQRDAADIHRLRGEVTGLRQQTNELARLRIEAQRPRTPAAGAGNPPEQPAVDLERQVQQQRMMDAKQLALAAILFATDNRNQLPEGTGTLGNYLGGDNEALSVATNLFEIVIRGSHADIAKPGEVILFREKEARLLSGKWVKTYAFADGHAEVVTDPPGGFEAWEKKHLPPSAEKK